jgi:hypothetical protein
MATPISKFAKWSASRQLWADNTFHRLIAEGKSESRAKKLTSLIERAGFEEFRPVPGSKGARYFLPGAPKTTPTISKNIYVKKQHGLSPMRLAAERKIAASQGQSPLDDYISAATRERAGKVRETRRKFREQLGGSQYDKTPANLLPYINAAGRERRDYFWKRPLAIMHQYRDACVQALATGDGRGLRKFKDRPILTYDGPDLPNYDNKGVPIFVETNVKKLQAARDAMTSRQLARFNADLNYRYITSMAA